LVQGEIPGKRKPMTGEKEEEDDDNNNNNNNSYPHAVVSRPVSAT
jgi:hypothetical protein